VSEQEKSVEKSCKILKQPDNFEVVPRPQAFKWSKRLTEGRADFGVDDVM
jgi:hypothetical protein